MLNRRLLGAVAALSLVALAGIPAYSQFPAQGDDTTTSLGSFQVNIAAQFQPLFGNCPAYNATSNVLQSPTLFDPATDIGRSSVLLDGSAQDQNGVPVGAANTVVGENILMAPPGFPCTGAPGACSSGAGTREVHTEVRSLHMTNGGAAVRAGIWYNSSSGTSTPPGKISPGEVESQSGPNGAPANDFPASSYFDVFAQVDMPACGNFPGATFYNTMPLIVKNSNLTAFPPRVIYLHDLSSIVPLLFLNNDTATPPRWAKDDIVGYIQLAGHGIGYTNSSSDLNAFNSFMASQPPGSNPYVPPVPSPTPTPVPPAPTPTPTPTPCAQATTGTGVGCATTETPKRKN